jgi:hypothetical protein
MLPKSCPSSRKSGGKWEKRFPERAEFFPDFVTADDRQKGDRLTISVAVDLL